MFSSLFGGRAGKSRGNKTAGKAAAAAAAEVDGAPLAEPDAPAAPLHGETLEAVIATQRKRWRACQRYAEKAEKRRDSYLQKAETTGDEEDAALCNEKATEAEELRKGKTAMFITLQAQISVLERVMTESGFQTQGLDEDFDEAEERMDEAEMTLREEREEIRVQRESAEEMSRLLSRNIAVHVDDDEDRGDVDQVAA